MTQVKICGITEPKSLQAAIDAGARFIGLVFYPPSPRHVSFDIAWNLARMIPTGVRCVGLFVDPDDALLERVATGIQLDMIQLHGDESAGRVAEIKARYNIPVMKAIRVGSADDLAQLEGFEVAADWLLFDAKIEKKTPPPSLRGEAGRGVANNARNLRKNTTAAEQLLWKHLKAKQLGSKFRRQHPIPPYVADFACIEKKLIIELDGSQHNEQTEYDCIRTDYLQSHGYRVLRFWNNDLTNNMTGVLETIHQSLHIPPPQSSPLFKGGGVIYGGTGESFDWSILKGRSFKKPWMLGGGLTPDNVAEALSILSPDAVDVSSGVESSRGIKDEGKIKSFIQAIKQA